MEEPLLLLSGLKPFSVCVLSPALKDRVNYSAVFINPDL